MELLGIDQVGSLGQRATEAQMGPRYELYRREMQVHKLQRRVLDLGTAGPCLKKLR